MIASDELKMLVKVAAQLRREADDFPLNDLEMRKELLQTAEGFETQAQGLRDSLREWKKDIN